MWSYFSVQLPLEAERVATDKAQEIENGDGKKCGKTIFEVSFESGREFGFAVYNISIWIVVRKWY